MWAYVGDVAGSGREGGSGSVRSVGERVAFGGGSRIRLEKRRVTSELSSSRGGRGVPSIVQA